MASSSESSAASDHDASSDDETQVEILMEHYKPN